MSVLYVLSLVLIIVILRYIGLNGPTDMIEAFVAYNTREYHDQKREGAPAANDTVFLESLSGQELAVSYNLLDTLQTLKFLVGDVFERKYDVISVKQINQFSFAGVTLRNRDTGGNVHVNRVTILADSLNPFIISRVLFTGVADLKD